MQIKAALSAHFHSRLSCCAGEEGALVNREQRDSPVDGGLELHLAVRRSIILLDLEELQQLCL